MPENSIDRHLTAGTREATLLAMRSARKEIFLVVEGDADINILSHLFGLSSSNFVSCNGKETLMALYARAKTKGIDEGTIFFRDRDHDGLDSVMTADVHLLVTTRYDLEMDLLDERVFARLVAEFERVPADKSQSIDIFEAICRCAAAIGAARLWSAANGVNINFQNLKYSKIVDVKQLSIEVEKMVRYLSAKSKLNIEVDLVSSKIRDLIDSRDNVDICCGEDIINICNIGFSKYYKFCDSKQSAPEIIWKMIRMSAHFDDIQNLRWFATFRQVIKMNPFSWTGRALQ